MGKFQASHAHTHRQKTTKEFSGSSRDRTRNFRSKAQNPDHCGTKLPKVAVGGQSLTRTHLNSWSGTPYGKPGELTSPSVKHHHSNAIPFSRCTGNLVTPAPVNTPWLWIACSLCLMYFAIVFVVNIAFVWNSLPACIVHFVPGAAEQLRQTRRLPNQCFHRPKNSPWNCWSTADVAPSINDPPQARTTRQPRTEFRVALPIIGHFVGTGPTDIWV